MVPMETSEKYCILGAGASGLAVAKTFAQQGIPFDAFEGEDDVGGNWYYGRQSSSVYASCHLISSKRMTEYTDFPMPKSYPPYPSHRQALDYLRSYARHFDLYPRITFRSRITRAEPVQPVEARSPWRVTLATGETHIYRGLVVASGHHWDPLWPDIPGSFTGEMFHAHDYKTPDRLRGKRVLVIGAGNSGCDIAVQAGQNAAAAYLSLRRGYHFLPKFVLGGPLDAGGELLHLWRLPLWLRRAITSFLVRIAAGPPQRYGLPQPDHKLLETHPIVNSQLLYHIGHGTIGVRLGVAEFLGDRVRFTDGREDQIDVVICATGYKVSFPFLDPSLVLRENGQPGLYLNAFHPQYDNFFVCGLIQPNSGLWVLADWQARLIAAFIQAQSQDARQADWFRRLKAQSSSDTSGGIRYVGSDRHKLEVEYYVYRELLKKLVRKLGGSVTPRPVSTPAT